MSSAGMGGGKKSANFELNLVPYIDLMSTLICFLLMTAIWQELDAMSSNSPPKATSEASDSTPPPPPDKEKKVMLTLSLGIDKTDMIEDEKISTIPHSAGEPNVERLVIQLKEWKSKFPDRKDIILATDNRAKYKHLVLMMDTLIAEKFPDVGINLN